MRKKISVVVPCYNEQESLPLFYAEMDRVTGLMPEVDFELLTETPKQTAEGEITECFARQLEQTIRREPAYWFWSHKRWKHKKEDFVHHG